MRQNDYHHKQFDISYEVAHWQTNFTETKQKLKQYLKKHHPNGNHPIVDAQHYVILENTGKNVILNPSLNCSKVENYTTLYQPYKNAQEIAHKKDQNHGKTYSEIFYPQVRHQRQQQHTQNSKKILNGSQKYCLPSIYNIKLENELQEQLESNGLMTLRKKLNQSRQIICQMRKKENRSDKQRLTLYHSIQVKKDTNKEHLKNIRSHSTHKPRTEQIKDTKQILQTKKSSQKSDAQEFIKKQSQKQIVLQQRSISPQLKAQDIILNFQQQTNRQIAHNQGVYHHHRRFHHQHRDQKQQINLFEKQKLHSQFTPWQYLKQEPSIITQNDQL